MRQQAIRLASDGLTARPEPGRRVAWMGTGLILAALAGPAYGQGAPPPRAEVAPAPPKYPDLEAFEATMPSWFPKLLGAQVTVINQAQPPFHSPYSGLNSLNQNGENKTSQTRSLALGSQVLETFQMYLDVEWFKGGGLHGGSGTAGYVNGEVVRSGSNLPETPYLARFYGRYVIPLSAGRAMFGREFDQLPGSQPTEYVLFKGGKMAASDDFDTNRYANGPRTQFLNYTFISNVAWDYAADTRGFTWGAVAGLVKSDWSLKLGAYAMPKTANGNRFDTQLSQAHGVNAELALKPLGNDTVIRFLAYQNNARMGRYSAAIAAAQGTGASPDIRADDRPGRAKYGFGLNAEIPLADDGDTGLFFRAGWNDGKTETFAFTEVDRTLSGGVQISGKGWGRDEDWIGVGLAANFLSGTHRDYLAAGGVGFQIGDGRLRYRPEEILESYYNFLVPKLDCVRMSPDYQFIRDPGYNADRGPVHVVSFRVRASM